MTRSDRGGTAWWRRSPLHAEGLLAAAPAVGHAVVVLGHDLDTLLAAPSRAATPGLLQRHQKSERGILELQVPEHVPVLAHVGLQELEDVPETDDAAGGDGGAGREGAEGDEAHGVGLLNLRGA